MGGVPAGEAVEAVEPLAGVEIVDGPFAVDGEAVRLERHVDGAPPDVCFGRGMADDPLVLGRAAGLRAGIGDQGPGIAQTRSRIESDRFFVKLRDRRIAGHILDRHAMSKQINGGSMESPKVDNTQ